MLFPSLNTPLSPPRNHSGVPQAETLARWLVASFQALEKNYLRELIFLVYLDPTKPEVIHEKFTFTFSYDEGVIKMGLGEGFSKEKKKEVKMEELKGETQDLLRKVQMVTQGLDKLPEEAYLAIKLTYYDEVTPKDYEPEGFRPDHTKETAMPGGSYRVSLGRADTGFHAIRLKMDSRQGTENNFVNDSFGAESQSQSQQLSGETPGESGGESSQSPGLEEKTWSGALRDTMRRFLGIKSTDTKTTSVTRASSSKRKEEEMTAREEVMEARKKKKSRTDFSLQF